LGAKRVGGSVMLVVTAPVVEALFCVFRLAVWLPLPPQVTTRIPSVPSIAASKASET
jgi:hypothetical protein